MNLRIHARKHDHAFRHAALFYAGEDQFVDSTASFIRHGLEADEPVLVVVGASKIELLRAALGGDAHRVHFADMGDVGRNPARIIPAWRSFVADRLTRNRPGRGIGEPIGPERNAAELVECERHEALLNLAFEGGPAWRQLCPYDTVALDPDVVEEARRNHPFVIDGDDWCESASYRGLASVAAPFDDPLPEPAADTDSVQLGTMPLEAVRRIVFTRAKDAGLTDRRAADLVLAVHEVAANTVRHGDGEGILRLWVEDDALISEVRDGGHIENPLAGREPPRAGQVGGWGLWMVNQLCDLAQIRSFSKGSAVRMHMRLDEPLAA